MRAPTLETERVILRGVELGDFDAYARMWADPAVTQFIGGTPRARDASWRRFCQAAGLWPLLDYGYWAAIGRNDGALIGIAGFGRFERGIDALEGYPEAGWAFKPAVWGQGIAGEVVATMIAWADSALPAPETRCLIDVGNAASVKIAVRNGFAAVAEMGDGARVFGRLRQARR